MSFERALWLFPAVVTLHNVEEVLWLPRWAARNRFPTPGPAIFTFAASILTILAFALTWLSFRAGSQSLWAYLVFGYMIAMVANVVVPHLAMTMLRRSYMPGLGTGIVVVMPVLSALAAQAVDHGFIAGIPAIVAAVLVPLALLASIPALFAVGRAIGL